MRFSTISRLMSRFRVAVLSIAKSGRQYEGKSCDIAGNSARTESAKTGAFPRSSGKWSASCCGSNDFHRALGQGINERLPVTLDQNTVVEDDNNPGVGLGADKAANTLAEFEDGFGQGKISERVAAVG